MILKTKKKSTLIVFILAFYFLFFLCFVFKSKNYFCFASEFEFKMDYLNEDYNFNLPSSYTATAQGLVTDVKLQGVSGPCWSFGSISALESSLIKQNRLKIKPDFSEMNMIYNLNQGASIDNPYEFDFSAGGDNIIINAYFSSGRGPVLEKDDPYDSNYKPRDYSITAQKRLNKYVREIVCIPDVDKFDSVSIKNHRELVKKFIYDNGSVASNIHVDKNYFDKTEKNYFYNSYNSYTNHTIALVGWDDNYPRENFGLSNIPENDGAFIVKNSWGKDKYDKGFFYISYEDKFAGFNACVFREIVDAQEKYYFENIYQHDYFGMTRTITQESLENKKNICSVFDLRALKNLEDNNKNQDKNKQEALSDIGIFIASNNVTCKFFLLNVSDSDKITGFTDYICEQDFKYPGYYVVSLPNKILLDKKKFAIGVNITGKNLLIACSEKAYDYCSKAESYPDQNFFGDKYGFQKVYQSLGYNINFCIKAFTEKDIIGAQKPVFKKFLKPPINLFDNNKKQKENVQTNYLHKSYADKSGTFDKSILIILILPAIGLISTAIFHNKFND